MSKAERRDNKRVPIKFDVNYVHDGDYLISFTENISVDGMFLYTENPPQVGDTILLTFTLGDLKDETLRARVMWVNQTKSSQDYGIGVNFINPPEKLQQSILQIIKRIALIEREQ
ncbi:PilZ domain-containing protein [Thermodesulfobacteriota bacterium]